MGQANSKGRQLAPWILAALAILAFMFVGGEVLPEPLRTPARVAVDALPPYLGGRALYAGLDPNDPVVLAEVFRGSGLQMSVGGFFNYYPPTAALLALPFCGIAFATLVRPLRILLALSLALGTALGATADARVRGAAGVAVAFGAAALVLLLHMSSAVLRVGQLGPLAVLLAGLGLWALSRGRERLAGAALGLGLAWKLVPGALLLSAIALRWRRTLILGLGIPVALLGLVLLRVPQLHLAVWAQEVTGFVHAEAAAAARHQEASSFTLWLSSVRIPLLGAGTLGFAFWAAIRRAHAGPPVATALAALALAWAGTAVAGSFHEQEAVQLLPCLGWVLGWPATGERLGWAGAVVVLVALWGIDAFNAAGPQGSLEWVPMGYLLWMLCAVRLTTALRQHDVVGQETLP